MIPLLRMHLEEFAGNERLFVSRDGSPLRGNTLYQAFVRARKQVGLDDLAFHDPRHTGQTLAAQTGATMADLMKRFGHSSMAAARRYFMRWMDATAKLHAPCPSWPHMETLPSSQGRFLQERLRATRRGQVTCAQAHDRLTDLHSNGEPLRDYNPSVTVKAWLSGHQFDLEELARIFSTGNVKVIQEGDGYYLTSPLLDSPPNESHYRQQAATLLVRMNGIARSLTPSHRPVGLEGRYTEPPGTDHTFINVDEELRFRDHATAIVTRANGDVVVPPPLSAPKGPLYLRAALNSPDAAEALEIMGRNDSLSWVDLYKVFEIVREAIAPIQLEKSGLANKNDVSAFKVSANRPDIGGPDARHARGTSGTPQHTMTITEAREFVGSLLVAWFTSLGDAR